MPKDIAPQIRGIASADYKNRKRLIKLLVAQRLAFGKSALLDTHGKKWRYSLDICAEVLCKAIKEAIKIGRILDLAKKENTLLAEVFKIAALLLIGCFLFFMIGSRGVRRTEPDFIEKNLGLRDDAIEKRLGLPEHSLEKFIESKSNEDANG